MNTAQCMQTLADKTVCTNKLLVLFTHVDIRSDEVYFSSVCLSEFNFHGMNAFKETK